MLGEALQLSLSPSSARFRTGVGGDALAFRAFGVFAVPPNGIGRARRDRSRHVVVDPPGIVRLDDVGTDQRRVSSRSPAARRAVVATDPASGRTAERHRHDLRSARPHRGRRRPRATRRARGPLDSGIGELARYFAHALLRRRPPYGAERRALRRERSRPSCRSRTVRRTGLRPGTVVISRDRRPDRHQLRRRRRPERHARGVRRRRPARAPAARASRSTSGQARSLTAVGYHDGRRRREPTRRACHYSRATRASSSRPTSPATGAASSRSARARRRSPATDPVTGVAHDRERRRHVVTVHGRIRRSASRSRPRPAAVAAAAVTRASPRSRHLASGATENVTQRVEWSTSDPAVAARAERRRRSQPHRRARAGHRRRSRRSTRCPASARPTAATTRRSPSSPSTSLDAHAGRRSTLAVGERVLADDGRRVDRRRARSTSRRT